MTTVILLASLLVAFTLTWLFRRRLTQRIPQTIKAAILTVVGVVFTVLALLLEVLYLVSLVITIGEHWLLCVVLAATLAVCVGCSKPVDPPKPQPIHWSSSEAGYHSESVVPDKGAPKKEP